MTEDEPVIKPYEEKRWAELADARSMPVEPSLVLLESLHARWVPLLRSLVGRRMETELPPSRATARSAWNKNAALYAWHGRHHVAHITALRERMGW